MSLDLHLIDRDTDEEVAHVNYLRNPFGLCQWAMDNAEPGLDFSLRFVCNEWAYDRGEAVNRPLFKAVVDAYGANVVALERGYFWFSWFPAEQRIKTLDAFASGNWTAPRCPDHWWPMEYLNDHKDVVGRGEKIGIPQEWFSCETRHTPRGIRWGWDASLPVYQAWYGQLIDFANLLQDERYRFYCSN